MSDLEKIKRLLEKLECEFIEGCVYEDEDSEKNVNHNLFGKVVGDDIYNIVLEVVVDDDSNFTGEVFTIYGTKNMDELFFGLQTYEELLKALLKETQLKNEMLKDEELRTEIQLMERLPKMKNIRKKINEE